MGEASRANAKLRLIQALDFVDHPYDPDDVEVDHAADADERVLELTESYRESVRDVVDDATVWDGPVDVRLIPKGEDVQFAVTLNPDPVEGTISFPVALADDHETHVLSALCEELADTVKQGFADNASDEPTESTGLSP